MLKSIDIPRGKLTDKESAFLDSVIPWSWYIQDQTAMKALVFKNFAGAYGLNSIVFLCMVLRASNWGNHPLSAEQFKGKDACNLLLLEKNQYWEGKTVKFDGKDYKLFNSYEHFCVDFADMVVFSGDYDLILLEKDYLKQIKLLTSEDSRCYDEIIKILSLLGIKNGK